MGRLFTTGFEVRDGLVDGGTLSTARSRTGAAALSLASGASGLNPTIAGATGRDYYARAYLYVATSGTNGPVVGFTAGADIYIRMNGDDTLSLLSDVAGVTYGTSPVLNVGQWYRVELHARFNTGSNDDTAEARIDGVAFASTTTADLGTTAPTGWTLGGLTSVGQAYIDDVAVNDSQGASQNTWPGDGKVVLLVPTADSAKGTGWTNDAAGTTNFFDAENNTPPVGIADTTASTGLHQIRNATSNANSSYDATMTTYAAAGISAGDTINVIDPIVATGAPVTTSSKQGTVGVVSNPAIANVALGAGGTSGAFWSGTAAGTYPTGWKISPGTLT
jgi:hypothetical protein